MAENHISTKKISARERYFFFYSTLAQISSHNWPNRFFPYKSLSIFRCTVGLDFKFGLQLDKHFKAKKLLVLLFSKKSSSIYDDRVQWRWEVNFFFKSWYMIARELYPFLMIAIFLANHWLVSIYTPYTAISRKFVGKHVHATAPKGNMGYDQYTVPDDCSCRTYFCCFLLAWPFVPILSNFFEKKRTQNHPQCLSGLSRALFPTTVLEIAV